MEDSFNKNHQQQGLHVGLPAGLDYMSYYSSTTVGTSSNNPFADAPHDEASSVNTMTMSEDGGGGSLANSQHQVAPPEANIVSAGGSNPRNVSPPPADSTSRGHAHDLPSHIHGTPTQVESSMSTSRSGIREQVVPDEIGSRSGTPEDVVPQAKGDATQILHVRYSQKHGIQESLKKKQFVWWSEGPDNQLKWSSAFVCPVSGEVFLAGSLRTHSPQVVNFGCCPSYYYSDKKMATKAAAGRAEDCFRLRENERGSRIAFFCVDTSPYTARYALPTDRLLDEAQVHGETRIEIEELQARAQARR
jgi:hypothetical protein